MKSLLGLSAVFATRGASALGSILLSAVIARMIGVSGFGQFTFFLSLVAFFSIIARRGLDVTLIRVVASAIHAGTGGCAIELFRQSIKKVLKAALVLSFAVIAVLVFNVFGRPIPGAIWVYLLCIPILSLLAITAGYLKGAGKAWLAPIFEIGGCSLAIAMIIWLLLFFEVPLSLKEITILFTMVLAIFCFLGLLLVRKDAHERCDSTLLNSAQKEVNRLFKGNFTFTLIALSGFLVQAGSFIVVAPFLSDEALGLARAAERLALIISFPILAINPFIASRFVRYTNMGHKKLVWQLFGKAIAVGVVIGTPPLLIMLFYPNFILSMLGPEFSSAAPFLRTLAIVNFVLVFFGPFSMYMNMTGGERQLIWVSGVAMVVALGLYPFFSIFFGVEGFVFSYALLSVTRAIVIALLAIKNITSKEFEMKAYVG